MHFHFQTQDLLENNAFFMQNSSFHIQIIPFFIVLYIHFVSVDMTQQTGTADNVPWTD
jgi:hypothetical protein